MMTARKSLTELGGLMRFPASLIPRVGLALFAAGLIASTAAAAGEIEAPFLAENDAAMARMMNGMAIEPSGDVDADFANMMIPHHQGAIDMALAELRYGHNEQLRRIAQEIIVDQQQEIAAMRFALGRTLPPSAPAPAQLSTVPRTGVHSGPDAASMKGMAQ